MSFLRKSGDAAQSRVSGNGKSGLRVENKEKSASTCLKIVEGLVLQVILEKSSQLHLGEQNYGETENNKQNQRSLTNHFPGNNPDQQRHEGSAPAIRKRSSLVVRNFI